MSRFYANISGQAKTEATRRGSAKSGITGHIRGWNVGIEVIGFADGEKDFFNVWLTSGSNGHKSSRIIGQFSSDDLEIL